MEIDIRKYDEASINTIRLADLDGDVLFAEQLRKRDCGFVIADSESDDDNELVVHDLVHAENLIKAIKKAIELGWVK